MGPASHLVLGMRSPVPHPAFDANAERRKRKEVAKPPSAGLRRDFAFERDVVRLHRLGPRAIAELLRDVGARTMRMTTIESKVADFADLEPSVVQALGGDQFARPPLTIIASADEDVR